jgi:serine/threonine protein phosphatase 1
MPDFQPAPATLPLGVRVYAIGDIHGCDDRLESLHEQIAADLAQRPIAHPLLIHLGDYIDRGPDSAGVLRRIARPLRDAPALPIANLIGNHEDMLLRTLASGSREDAGHWLANGGGATLQNWGISWRDSPASWADSIPPEQLGLLRSLGVIHVIGGYAFVHAGLRPGVALHAQTRDDMLWIREPFLSFEGRLPAVAVHGHTPAHTPEIRPHRIGIDTGAVLAGRLTCAILEADQVAFLQA